MSTTSTKTAAMTFTTKKALPAAALLFQTPPLFKPLPWATNVAPTTTKPTTTSTTKRAATTPFDFDAFLEKEEAEISTSEGKPKKLGLKPATDTDLIEEHGTASAPSGGGLSGLMSSAGKLFSGLGLPGFGSKKVAEKKVVPASDEGEPSDSDGAENPDGEGDVSEDESAEQALATPKKLDLGSLLNNAGDLIAPHLKTLGIGGLGGAAGGGNPLAGLLSSFGGLFGGKKASAVATTEAPLE